MKEKEMTKQINETKGHDSEKIKGVDKFLAVRIRGKGRRPKLMISKTRKLMLFQVLYIEKELK